MQKHKLPKRELKARNNHKRTVKALADSEARYRKFIENAQEGVIFLDSKARICFVNDHMAKMLGYKPKEMLGKPELWLAAPDKRKQAAQKLAERRKGTSEQYGFEYRHKNGGRVIASINASPIMGEKNEFLGTVAFVTDITAQHQNKLELERKAQELQTVMEASGRALILDRQSTALELSQNTAKALNMKVDDLKGRNIWKLLPPEVGRVREARLKEAVKTGKPLRFEDLRGGRYHEHRLYPILDKKGKCGRVVWLSWDITDQKNTERRLKDGIALMESVFKSTQANFALLDKDFNYLFVNRSYAEQCAMTHEQMVGKNMLKLFPDREVERTYRKVMRTGKPLTLHAMPYDFPNQPGRPTTYWDWTLQPLKGPDGKLDRLLISSVEVGEQKRAQLQLAESESKYRRFIENSLEGVMSVDPQFRINYVNRRFARMLGYKEKELIGKSGFGIMDPELVKSAKANLKKRAQGVSETIEFRYLKKDGSIINALVSANPIMDEKKRHLGTVYFSTDIAERKRAEQALARSELFLQEAGKLARVGGWELDAKTKEVRFTKEIYRIYEIPLGQTPTLAKAINFFHPGDRPKLKRAVQRAFDYGEPYDMEIRFITAKGKHLWTRTICKPLKEKGKTVKLIGSFQDITERKQSEEKTRRLYSLLEASRRISQSLARTNDETGLYQEICDALKDVWYIKYVWIGLVDKSHYDVIPIAQAGQGKNYMSSIKVRWDNSLLGSGPTGTAIKTAKPSVMRDMENDPRFRPWRAEARKRGYRSSMVVPIILDGEVIGACNLYSEERDAFGKQEIGFLTEVSDDIAFGIKTLRLQKKLVEKEKMFERFVEGMPAAIYAVDSAGKPVYESQSLRKILGRSLLNTPGLYPIDLTCIAGTDTPYPHEKNVILSAFNGEKATIDDCELRRDGQVIPIELSGAPIYDQQGKLEYAVVAVRDITERKRGEEEVRQSRQMLNNLLEMMPVYVVLLKQDYHVRFANRFSRERFGEDKGRRCYEYLLGRTEPCEVCETFTALKTNAPHHWEWTGPDGRIYNRTDIPFKEADGSTMILEVGIDITERKLAEDQVRSMLKYNRSLIEASLDPLVTISHDGKIMDVNFAAENATGASRDEMVGTDFSDYFTDPERARAGYKQVLQDGYLVDYELAIRNLDGKITPVLYNAAVYRDENGKVAGIFAAARDITTRKKAEELLRLEEKRLRSTLKISSQKTGSLQELLDLALDEAIALSDSKIGYLYYYNEEKQEFTLHAWSKEVMKECTIPHPPTIYQLEKTGIWGEAVRQRGPIIVNDFSAPNPLKKGYPQGHSHISRFLTVPVISDGRIFAVVGVANKPVDYTEQDASQLTLLMDSLWKIAERNRAEEAQKKAEQELEKQRVQAIHADRLRNLGEMAASVAHELNQPLVGIRGLAEHISLAFDRGWNIPRSEIYEKVKLIVEQADRMSHVVEHTRTFGRQADRSELSAVSVNDVIESSMVIIKPMLRSYEMTLETQLAPALPRVLANPFSLEEIILNLVSNARDATAAKNQKFTEENGIIIRTGLESGEAGEFVLVQVIDRGCGIPEEDMDKLFQPFYSTKEAEKGTGLGLSISKNLVEGFGGRIEVKSKLGEGTTVTIKLPAIKKGGEEEK